MSKIKASQALIEYTHTSLQYDLGIAKEEHLNLKIEKELIKIAPSETTSIYYQRVGRDVFDIIDKKCKYHRTDYGKSYHQAAKFLHKYLGKTKQELLNLVYKKKLKHFVQLGFINAIEDAVKNKEYSTFCFNSEGKLELKEKKLTTKSEFNPYRYRRFNPLTFLEDVKKRTDLPMIERFEKIIQVLEYNGYEVKIYGEAVGFIGKGVNGYISIEEGYYYGKIFADYHEFFDKVSRCPLVLPIPKSQLGAKSVLKSLEFLGSKKGKQALLNGTYLT